MPRETIRIKRYPNRRLYDQSASRYVTLADIEQAVRDGDTVEIRDSQTNEDLTRSVLTQIIIERHPEKLALVPSSLLHYMLRADDAMTEFLRFYFQDSLSTLERLSERGAAQPAMVEPMQWMQAWLSGFTPLVSPGPGPSQPASGARTTAQPQTGDMEQGATENETTPTATELLRRKIEQLERRVGELESGAEAPADDASTD